MIIAPSVLSLDYSKFKEQLDILNANVKWLHFDVMDGHFVPNITFGPDILNTFRRNSSLFLDAHLMISNPEKYIERFVSAGADQITIHYEACKDIDECSRLIDKIHSYYVKAGVSIKPNTSYEEIIPILDKVDVVLLMSVEPGFGGQEFIPMVHDKIKALNKYRKKNKLKYLLEIDGGINEETASRVLKEGIDVIAAGSFIFKGDIIRNINILENCNK